MEPIILWQQKWGLSFNVPWYLFLGGLAGGTMTIGGLADLLAGRRPRLREFARVAAYITPPVIIAGGLALTFHLGKPERGFLFPLFFTNYQSWLTIGGWILGAFAPVTLAYAAAWHFRLGRRTRLALAAVGAVLGLVMSAYTGLLLAAAWMVPGARWFVPLWDRTYLPVLFVLSGFSTAFAACGLSTLIAGRLGLGFSGERPGETARSVAETTSLIDTVAIVVEGAWVYLFLASLAVGTLGQQLALRLVTRGDLAGWFWVGFVATGLAAPLLASAVHEVSTRVFHARAGWALYAEFVLVLAGGLLLRYVMVWGGDLKAPLFFPPSVWPVPVVGTLPLLSELAR